MGSDRHFPGYVPNPHYTQDDWDDVCDNPELTDDELAQAVPLAIAMPELVEAIRRQRGEPEPTHDFVWLRLDRDILAAFRDSGPHWQARLNAILGQAVAGGALDAVPDGSPASERGPHEATNGAEPDRR